MTAVDNIIFDLGNVLIHWDPKRVYREVFAGDEQKVDWFLSKICPMDWNENQDAGYPLAKATEDRIALYPAYENWIRMYYGRWEEMLGGAIEPTVKILYELKEINRFKIVALTNWSAETFPIAQRRFDFLNVFEGIVVSGEEKTRKPFTEIYRTCLDRFKLKPESSLFIDDNQRNIEAAQRLGIQTHLFTSADKLRKELLEREMLTD
ncbi:MAG: HAD family hydrolase [Flavobacteriaceae bacterium]